MLTAGESPQLSDSLFVRAGKKGVNVIVRDVLIVKIVRIIRKSNH